MCGVSCARDVREALLRGAALIGPFANTDLAGASDHRNSIGEADRAVKQLIGV